MLDELYRANDSCRNIGIDPLRDISYQPIVQFYPSYNTVDPPHYASKKVHRNARYRPRRHTLLPAVPV
jgi:hypothetical protein